MELPRTSQPASRALAAIGVQSLEDLTRFTKREIADLHGMGPKVLDILSAHLRLANLDFKND